jgi:hypothetical protein
LLLHPEAGSICLHSEGIASDNQAKASFDHLVTRRRPAIRAGSVGAIALRILNDVIIPRGEELGFSVGRPPDWKRAKNTPTQRKWRRLRYAFRELSLWFAHFPADDFTEEDLRVFLTTHDSGYGFESVDFFAPLERSIRRLLRQAGLLQGEPSPCHSA